MPMKSEDRLALIAEYDAAIAAGGSVGYADFDDPNAPIFAGSDMVRAVSSRNQRDLDDETENAIIDVVDLLIYEDRPEPITGAQLADRVDRYLAIQGEKS